ncbi:ras-related protein Rab-7L1-like [Dysidea avara]|uniref:ras-related protein Rab-7L1-like n=1 Tax=Dysidea avara TaxID=196820 RepID=UPI00331E4FE2
MTETQFKVLIIGDPSTGKTSFVERYVNRRWLPHYKPTFGAEYHQRSIRWSESDVIRLHLWDMAGQDQFQVMCRSYYQGASGCCVLFDVTNQKSLESCAKWKKEVDTRVTQANGDPVPSILLANKSDLVDKTISQDSIEKFSKDNGFIYWNYISVKTYSNVEESITHLIKAMLKVLIAPPHTDTIRLSRPVEQLPAEENGPNKRSCCSSS